MTRGRSAKRQKASAADAVVDDVPADAAVGSDVVAATDAVVAPADDVPAVDSTDSESITVEISDDFSATYPFENVTHLYAELDKKLDLLAATNPEVSGIAKIMFEIQNRTLEKMVDLSKVQTSKQETEINALRRENFIAESRITRLETEVKHMQKEILEMREYAMINDIIFEGIPEQVVRHENTEWVLRQFLKSHLMLFDADNILFDDVHRLGRPRTNGDPRPIICKFVRRIDKRRILSCGKLLSGKPHLSMYEHLPQAVKEERRELYAERKVRKDNGESKVYVRGPKLLVNDVVIKDISKIRARKTPKNEELNKLSAEYLSVVKDIPILEKEVDGSRFKSMFLPLDNPQDLQPALLAMRAHAQSNGATHNVWAANVGALKDHDDDGEFSAGYKLSKVLAASEKKGLLLVIRYYGGSDIGEKRFTAICDLGKAALGLD